TATPLAYLGLTTGGPAARTPLAVADLSTASDVDLYALTVPAGATGPLTVSVRASGVSLVTPRLDVLDAQGRVVASAATTDPLHNALAASVAAPAPGATYYARVAAAQPGVFGIGSYRIAAGQAALVTAAAALPQAPGVVAVAGDPKHPVDLSPTAP